MSGGSSVTGDIAKSSLSSAFVSPIVVIDYNCSVLWCEVLYEETRSRTRPRQEHWVILSPALVTDLARSDDAENIFPISLVFQFYILAKIEIGSSDLLVSEEPANLKWPRSVEIAWRTLSLNCHYCTVKEVHHRNDLKNV